MPSKKTMSSDPLPPCGGGLGRGVIQAVILLPVLLTAAVFVLAQDQPVPTKESAQRMTLPPGFQATLFAGEPDVVQPIAFTFDDRGRVWVVECYSYPDWIKTGKGKD